MNKSYKLLNIVFVCLVFTPVFLGAQAGRIGDGLIIRVMDHMLYVDIGSEDNVREGDMFDIIEPEVLTHPLNGDTLSVTPKNIGAIRIIQVFPKMALAELTHIETPKDPMLKHISSIQDARRLMEIEHLEKMSMANDTTNRSMLVPGLYQYQFGDRRKGFGLLSAEFAALIVGVGYRMSSNDWMDQYNNLGPGLPQTDFDYYFKEADQRRTTSNRAFFIAGAIYAYSLFDVLWMQDGGLPLSLELIGQSKNIAMLKLKHNF